MVALALALKPAPTAAQSATQATAGTSVLEVQALGLTMPLPEGSRADTTALAGSVSARAYAPNDIWRIDIATRTSSNQSLDTLTIARSAVEQLLLANSFDDPRSGEKRTVAEALNEPEAFVIDAAPGHRVYVAMPNPERTGDLIQGFAVAKLGPGRFITFELFTTGEHEASARADFERALDLASLSGAVRADAERALAIRTGQALLATLTPEALDDAINRPKEIWHRLYRPAGAPTAVGTATEDIELGYRRIRTSTGSLADIDPANEPDSDTDRTPGAILRIDARSINTRDGTQEPAQIIDIQSAFFVSMDGRSESWLVRMAVKDAGPTASGRPPTPVVWTQTGARTGESMSVTTQRDRTTVSAARPTLREDGYLPVVHTFLVPRILARAAVPGAFGFYAFNTNTERVAYRAETLEQHPEIEGHWLLRTRPAPDLPDETSHLAPDGTLVRQNLADGRRWEPVSLNELLDRWKAKGLPLD